MHTEGLLIYRSHSLSSLMSIPIDRMYVEESLRRLDGMYVSSLWKGYGSALFMELTDRIPSSNEEKADAHIFIGYNWRFEHGPTILCGSGDPARNIAAFTDGFVGHAIASIECVGDVGELVITLRDGSIARTFQRNASSDAWHVVLPDRYSLSFEEGRYTISNYDDPGSTPQTVVKELEDIHDEIRVIADRWRSNSIRSEGPTCHRCRHFTYLDGSYDLINFGVCSSVRSGFDGRVVSAFHHCPEHTT